PPRRRSATYLSASCSAAGADDAPAAALRRSSVCTTSAEDVPAEPPAAALRRPFVFEGADACDPPALEVCALLAPRGTAAPRWLAAGPPGAACCVSWMLAADAAGLPVSSLALAHGAGWAAA